MEKIISKKGRITPISIFESTKSYDTKSREVLASSMAIR